MGKVKAADIREKSRADLLSQVDELKKELSQVRCREIELLPLLLWRYAPLHQS